MMKKSVSANLKGRIKMSKRIGDKTGKYLVATMTERQKQIAQLKSSLNSLSIDELVIKAIDKYPVKPKKETCSSCGSETVVNTKPYEYHINIADKDVVIEILNYPYLKCKNCDEEWFDLSTEKYLEDLLHFEIMQS